MPNLKREALSPELEKVLRCSLFLTTTTGTTTQHHHGRRGARGRRLGVELHADCDDEADYETSYLLVFIFIG